MAPQYQPSAPLLCTALPSATQISYSDLKGLLNQCIDGSSDVCKVDRVDFKDALGETAEATVEGRALFVVGIPKDNPNNDSR